MQPRTKPHQVLRNRNLASPAVHSAEGRVGRPPRGKTLLSGARIIKTALSIVDEAGVDALSMRSLAARLSVTAMSLYRYCDSHDVLLDTIHDEIIAQHLPHPVTKEQSYREVLTEMAKALRRAIKAHPNAAILFATRPVRGSRSAAHLDAMIGRLLAAGFELSIAVYLIDAVSAFTIGLCLSEFARTPRAVGAPMAPSSPAADGDLLHLKRLAQHEAKHDYETEFVVGLLAMIDGFGARYAKRTK